MSDAKNFWYRTPSNAQDHLVPLMIGALVVLFLGIIVFMKTMQMRAYEKSPLRNKIATLEARLDSFQTSNLALTSQYDSLLIVKRKQSPEVIWLARAIYSETKTPAEMRLVAWVIRNRVENNFRGRDNYRDVILDRKQFSAFNYGSKYRNYYLTKSYLDDNQTWQSALQIAYDVVYADISKNPLKPNTYYFYSEVSMPDTMPHPYWVNDFDRVKNLPYYVDEKRFRFFSDNDNLQLVSN